MIQVGTETTHLLWGMVLRPKSYEPESLSRGSGLTLRRTVLCSLRISASAARTDALDSRVSTASRVVRDSRSGLRRRHHVLDGVYQDAVSRAGKRAENSRNHNHNRNRNRNRDQEHRTSNIERLCFATGGEFLRTLLAQEFEEAVYPLFNRFFL